MEFREGSRYPATLGVQKIVIRDVVCYVRKRMFMTLSRSLLRLQQLPQVGFQRLHVFLQLRVTIGQRLYRFL